MSKNGIVEGKVAIIGAGFVGSTAAYALMIKGIPSELVLIDIHKEVAEGHAMDLAHGMVFTKDIKIEFSDKLEKCKGAEVIVITAGAHQEKGETRLDLIKKNAALFKQMIPKLAKCNKNAIYLIVTNPVDILTYLTIMYGKLNPKQVIGSGTILDTARLREIISCKVNINPRSIHAFVLGEHGDSEFVAWSNASIAGKNIKSFLSEKDMNEISNQTKNAAYEIIAKKGATYYAIGLGICQIINAVLNNQNEALPVSTLLEGDYGIKDICLSLPCVVSRCGVVKKIDLDLSKAEIDKLRNSAEILKSYIKKIK